MIDVVVEYPFMLFKRKAMGRAPASWDELTEKQFIGISKVVHGATPDYRLLALLTGISRDILKKLSPFQLIQLSKTIDFIGRAGSSHSNFIISELPCVAGKCIAPKPKLEAITFGQFIFMDAYYNDWTAFKQETALNKFIAAAYLHPNEKFSNEVIEQRMELIDRIDIEIRKAIAFNYSLIVYWLQKAYPLLFVDTQQTEDADAEPKQPQSAWLKIFDGMVGDDLINRDKYAELPLHTVFRHLTKRYKENARK